jgi:hypothetical protein
MTALDIASWLGHNGACGSCFHGVVMLFMNLCVFTKLRLDVFVEVNLDASN